MKEYTSSKERNEIDYDSFFYFGFHAAQALRVTPALKIQLFLRVVREIVIASRQQSTYQE